MQKFVTQKFVIDVIIQLIFPWPNFEYIVFMPQLRSSEVNYVPYYLSDLIMIFMFVRIYGLIRHFERYHEFTDLASKQVCRSYGFTSGRMFTMKCELFYHQATFISILFLSSVIILSYILRVFELPYE